MVLISIITDIALSNPVVQPITSAILSKFISFLDNDEQKREALARINLKLQKIPNTGHQQIWLQRLSLAIDADITYEEDLCTKVIDAAASIWNSDWLEEGKLKKMMLSTIIDQEEIDEMDSVIKTDEVALFKATYK